MHPKSREILHRTRHCRDSLDSQCLPAWVRSIVLSGRIYQSMFHPHSHLYSHFFFPFSVLPGQFTGIRIMPLYPFSPLPQCWLGSKTQSVFLGGNDPFQCPVLITSHLSLASFPKENFLLKCVWRVPSSIYPS